MSERDDFQRTIGYGESALGQLKRNQIPAYPRNYELWYTYAAGFNRSLNRAVNDILRARGRITSEELQHIYNSFLSPSRLGDRIEEVGGKVATEIEDLSSLIERTLGETADYGMELNRASAALATPLMPHEIEDIISQLLVATRKVDSNNRQLEAQLADSKAQLDALHANLEAIRYESLTDQLTTLANRKHFDQTIERALFEAETDGTPLSLLLTDIDHFKRFNDSYGHQTGDQVLRLVALAVKQNIKGQDIACRYGGEEFAIILPRTAQKQAIAVAEHIREAVMAKELVKRSTGETLGRITVSIGIGSYRAGDTVQSLIERTDACLYAAKNHGRNKVVSEVDHDLLQKSVA